MITARLPRALTASSRSHQEFERAARASCQRERAERQISRCSGRDSCIICDITGDTDPFSRSSLSIGEPLAPDPLAPPAGRRRRFHFTEIRFGANDGARAFGANDRSCGRRRAPRATGSSPTPRHRKISAIGSSLRRRRACNNAVRRLVLLYPLAVCGRRLDGTGLATWRTSGIQGFLPVKMPETGTFSKKTGRLLRKDGQLP